eukprot:jgi/Ulvmu1/12528/UM090_0015.1
MPFGCAEALSVHETEWQPSSITVPLQMELDACFVPSSASGHLRVDVANVVVIDGLMDDHLRQALLELLSEDEFASAPPGELWEQRTIDDASNPQPSWGLKDSQLLLLKNKWAAVELHSRLQLVYPNVSFFHMPADAMQAPTTSKPDTQQNQAVHGLCEQFVANAAVSGNQFLWHVDADPSNIPPDSDWASKMGLYANREPSQPRFVSLIAYLNSQWQLNEHAETLFLDSATDTGAFVRPKPGRVVIMDQDVLHRASAPASAAGRPRYSLVWKLLACASPPLRPSSTNARPERSLAARAAQTLSAGGQAQQGTRAAAAAVQEHTVAGSHRKAQPGGSDADADAAEDGTIPPSLGSLQHQVGRGEAGTDAAVDEPLQQRPQGRLGEDMVAPWPEERPVGQEQGPSGGRLEERPPQQLLGRSVSILLPEHSGVTALGSARRMRDLQEQVTGRQAASAAAGGGFGAKRGRQQPDDDSQGDPHRCVQLAACYDLCTFPS